MDWTRQNEKPRFVIDISKGKLDVCAFCSHQIFFQEGMESWMHFVPVMARQRCSVKSCSCGGNGMEIYGDTFKNDICGICKEGSVCPCTNPQPMVLIKNG